MKAMSAITTIRDGSISFKGLEKLNNQQVEVFVYSMGRDNSKVIKEQKRKFFQFQGIIESNLTDTSKNVDQIIQ